MQQAAVALVLISLPITLALADEKAPRKPDVARPKLSTTMNAEKQKVPATIEVKPHCQEHGFLILDGIPEGKAFTIEIEVSAGCAWVDVRKGNGSPNNMPGAEVCADKGKKRLEAVGQAGRTFLQVNETGACKGNTVTLVVK